MSTFEALQISKDIIAGLAKDKITVPTSVQLETIPTALEHKDVIAEAVTGSGKTLAYLLPSFEKIDPASKDLHTLVIAPTHELVVQINNVIKKLAKDSNRPVRSTTIIGQVNVKRQVEALKKKPHIIVGTPGRVLELIKKRKIKAHQVKTVVIDEADKLFSDDNMPVIMDLVKTTMRDRQMMVFSASLPEVSIKRAIALMKEPKLVNIDFEPMNEAIEHICILSERRDKITNLRKVIHAVKPKKAIIFINRNELVQEVAMKLAYHKIKAVAIYGNATKNERKSILDAFRSGKSNVLVASDLVARGLDLKDITHVISMDVPEDLNEYTHRAGRTGRAGNEGTSITLITEKEIPQLLKIQKMTGIEFDVKELYMGQLVEPSEDEEE
jgi:superfamily II DNA/RNA helicase